MCARSRRRSTSCRCSGDFSRIDTPHHPTGRPMRTVETIRRWRLWPMLWKEFVQMRRDRLTLAILVVIPAVQLVIFGYAIRTEVRHLPTVVLDQSRTQESRALVAVLRNTGNFDVVASVASRAEL